MYTEPQPVLGNWEQGHACFLGIAWLKSKKNMAPHRKLSTGTIKQRRAISLSASPQLRICYKSNLQRAKFSTTAPLGSCIAHRVLSCCIDNTWGALLGSCKGWYRVINLRLTWGWPRGLLWVLALTVWAPVSGIILRTQFSYSQTCQFVTCLNKSPVPKLGSWSTIQLHWHCLLYKDISTLFFLKPGPMALWSCL